MSIERLRRPYAWAALLLLCVAVVTAHRILPDQVSELATHIVHTLHGPGFGGAALLILLLLPAEKTQVRLYVKAGLLAFGLTFLAEAAQIPGPRDAQFSDIVTDAIGIIGFLGVAAIVNRKLRRTLSRFQIVWLMLLCVPAFFFTLQPTVWASYVLAKRQQGLPQIASFDAAWESLYITTNDGYPKIIDAPSNWPQSSAKIAHLTSSGRWGIMLYVFPHADWSKYSALSFVAATPDTGTQRITIGIRDIRPGENAPYARYMVNITIGPEPARYSISFDDILRSVTTRRFDLAHVQDIVISDSLARKGIEILVDDFRLE